jgi:hypothetical protein
MSTRRTTAPSAERIAAPGEYIDEVSAECG